jgi:hypothetical protein
MSDAQPVVQPSRRPVDPPWRAGVRLVARRDVGALRAARWAFFELRRVKRTLAADGLAGTAVRPSPSLPTSALRGVLAVMRRTPGTCLEEALVLQRWLSDHGDPRQVVIGVGRPDGALGAHAWVDGERFSREAAYGELMRLDPPSPS